MSTIPSYWQQRLLPGDDNESSNFAIAMFLFMVCTMEAILLKITLAPMFNREVEYDNSSEYEEDIYYEELYENISLWPRRRRTQNYSNINYDNLPIFNNY